MLRSVLFVCLVGTALGFYEHDPQKCKHVFISGISARQEGWIESPGYPASYTSQQFLQCKYMLLAGAGERVQVEIVEFLLATTLVDETTKEMSNERCRTDQDRVTFWTNTRDPGSEIGTYCGESAVERLMSGANGELAIAFLRNDTGVDGGMYRYRFKYRFVTNFGITTGFQKDPGECHFFYGSSIAADGSLSSPNYPGLYPKSVRCVYEFFGGDNETIHLQLNHFNVIGADGCLDEWNDDYLLIEDSTADSTATSGSQRLFCGSTLPPHSYTSPAAYLRVTFVAGGGGERLGNSEGSGFQIGYRFVNVADPSRTNWTTSAPIADPLPFIPATLSSNDTMSTPSFPTTESDVLVVVTQGPKVVTKTKQSGNLEQKEKEKNDLRSSNLDRREAASILLLVITFIIVFWF